LYDRITSKYNKDQARLIEVTNDIVMSGAFGPQSPININETLSLLTTINIPEEERIMLLDCLRYCCRTPSDEVSDIIQKHNQNSSCIIL